MGLTLCAATTRKRCRGAGPTCPCGLCCTRCSSWATTWAAWMQPRCQVSGHTLGHIHVVRCVLQQLYEAMDVCPRVCSAVLSNDEVIAINQDPLVVPARRVAVLQPACSTLGVGTADNVAVVAACDATRPTQFWQWVQASNVSQPVNQLYIVPCTPGDPLQAWRLVANYTRSCQCMRALDGLSEYLRMCAGVCWLLLPPDFPKVS